MSAGPAQVVILAGGLGTRLGELSRQVPKSLLELAGRPFAAHQLDLLRAAGLKRVLFLVGHLGERIRAVLGDGRARGLELDYCFEPPGRLAGTGGALAQARDRLDESFYLLYGDSYLPCDYRAVGRAFLAAGRPALMVVYRNRGRYDTSNAVFDEAAGLVRRYSKRRQTPAMEWIDYGLSVLTRPLLDEGAGREPPWDLGLLYEELAAAGRLAGYEAAQRFYEVGSPAGLAELGRLLEEKEEKRR